MVLWCIYGHFKGLLAVVIKGEPSHKKSCIRETLILSTYADDSSNIYIFLIRGHLSGVMFYVSHVWCHVSGVTCHLSPVTFH